MHNFLIFTRLVLLDCGWPVVICAEKLFANVVHLFNNEFTLNMAFFLFELTQLNAECRTERIPGETHTSYSMFSIHLFYVHFGISHKTIAEWNAKMRINSKNAHKKRINFLSDNKKCA